VHFAEPDDYGPQWSGRWAIGPLPMIPEPWRLKTERSTAKQFQVVKRLLNDAGTERVVCATDAGREGENIFRLIYEHARCRKPVQRLWVSSLTDEAIREGCDFVVWKELGGKRLTGKQVHASIGKGKTGLLEGFKSESGKRFDARLRLDPQWRVVFDLPPR
jgi:hypothetical protein